MLAPDTVLQNRYRIVRKLGQGGMGAIYEAVDQRVSCVVAIKQTLVTTLHDSKDAFYREAALLANLRHSSLPKVMDYFTEDGGEFLVMEFIAGEDLLQLLMRHDGPLPQLQVLPWAIELLKLLEYLHTHEPAIIHRDIKPANLKLTKQGELFLLDFGLAKGTSGQMITMETDRSVPGYTPVYSPLEQILGQGTDQRSDLYALGATLFHLLTGQPPVSAAARFSAIENNQPDPLKPANQLNIGVASEVAVCIHDALALSRKNRTATAREMRVVLEQAVRIISERELVHKVEQTLLDDAQANDLTRPLIKDDGVQFTVYSPQQIKPEKNYTILAFAHLSKRRDDAAPDEPDPLEEVKKQAERVLGEERKDYADAKRTSKQSVPRGGELTFVPVVRGVVFSPPSRNFHWRKSVHREEFDVFASTNVDGQTLSGSMTVFLGSVVIADVPLTLAVNSQATSSAESISPERPRSARRVRQVFASYSNKDEQIVAELAQVAPIFGSRFLLDRTHLEPGEDRVEGLQRLIRDADVFQLFWSTNSMRSPDIADEIRYAIGLSRPGFILPTYWEEPVPRSPEEGLPPAEIDRLQFYRIYPSAISRPTLSSLESKVVITGPAGAEIYLDDARFASIGSSGRVVLNSIPTGKHLLRITSLGNRDDERIIEVGPQFGEQQIEASFTSENLTAPAPAAAAPAEMAFKVERAASRNYDTVAAPSSMPVQASPSPSVASKPAIDLKICISCGVRYPIDMTFCARCGSVLRIEAELNKPAAQETSPAMMAAPSPSYQSSPQQYHAPKAIRPKRGWMIPVMAGAAMVLFLVVAAPLWFITKRPPQSPTTAASNGQEPVKLPAEQELPVLSFVDLTGARLSLKHYSGRVVLLNVWSIDSVASRAEVSVLNDVQESFARPGLTVIGIAIDSTAEQVKQFQREVPQKYQVGLPSPGSHLSSMELPTTFVIDRKGNVRKKLIGVQRKATLIAAIEPLLNEQP